MHREDITEKFSDSDLRALLDCSAVLDALSLSNARRS